MNSTDVWTGTTLGPLTGTTNGTATATPTAAATPAISSSIQVLTTAASSSSVTAFHAVIIVIFLLTIGAALFLSYRYFCHDKGDYRLSGEVTPWEEPVEPDCTKANSESKEYFI